MLAPPKLAVKPGQFPVLAQIPDLDAAGQEQDEQQTPESEGRLIGQRSSAKLLIGGGLILIALTILPLAFRKSESKPTGTTASDASQATPSAPADREAIAPSTANGPALVAPGETSASPAAYLQPQQAGANRPMALNDPAIDGRPSDRMAAPVDYQADRRGDPAADYRATRTDYPGSGGPQGNPLMPSPTAIAPPDTQPVEPGVARFEGTIERPPFRSPE